MRRIERTGAFRRDFKRQSRGRYRSELQELLETVILVLAEDRALPAKNRDHALAGDWSDFRECHLKPDLLLIYRKPEAEVLQLVRLGSHSDLFG